MRRSENMWTLGFRGLLASALWTALAPCASGATVCYEGRYRDASGDVKANVQVPATIRAYAREDAAEALGAAETMIATDDEGRFAALAEGLDVPDDCATFWIGVTPQGGDEIKPRMRVSPAPFAIVAAKVQQVESAHAVMLGGDLTATKVGDPGVVNADATADNVMLTSDATSTLRGSVVGAKDIYIRKLYLNNGNASLMRTRAPNGAATRWSDFDADYSMSVTGTTGLFGYGNQKKTDSFTAEDDGIVMVMIRVDISLENDPDYWVKATLTNGDFMVLDNTLIGVTGSANARLFTFPVRKGNKVALTLHNYRAYGWRDVESWAKAKVVYFGANRERSVGK